MEIWCPMQVLPMARGGTRLCRSMMTATGIFVAVNIGAAMSQAQKQGSSRRLPGSLNLGSALPVPPLRGRTRLIRRRFSHRR
jgi:hypothetical protein